MKNIDPNGLMLSMACVFLAIIVFYLIPWAVENLKDAIGNLRRNKLMDAIGNNFNGGCGGGMGENVPMTKKPYPVRTACEARSKSLGTELQEIREVIGELERMTDEMNNMVTGDVIPYDPLSDSSSLIMDTSNIKFRLLRIGQSLKSIKEGLGD